MINSVSTRSRQAWPIRIFVVVFGCSAILWGLTTLPGFWRQSSLERTAQRIISGEPFKVKALAGELPVIGAIEKSSICSPEGLRSAAIIRLHIAEQSRSDGYDKQSDALMDSAAGAVRESLFCLPADPFLWLAMYWVDSAQHGYRPRDLKYLEMSYQLGPNEGWIAVKRNGAAFAIFRKLPSDLAEIAVKEFVSLVRAKFYEQAADIFAGPAWPERDLIVPLLASVPALDRQMFLDALSRRGLDEGAVGIARGESRPWR